MTQAVFLSYASQDADAAGGASPKMHCHTVTCEYANVANLVKRLGT